MSVDPVTAMGMVYATIDLGFRLLDAFNGNPEDKTAARVRLLELKARADAATDNLLDTLDEIAAGPAGPAEPDTPPEPGGEEGE